MRSIAFSPDGSKIVSGGDDKAVKIWDVKSGELLWDGQEHAFRVVAVAFSTDGTSISSVGAKDITSYYQCDQSGEFKTWDANTGQLKHSVTVDEFDSLGSAISLSGRLAICTNSLSGVWDVNTGTSRSSQVIAGPALIALKPGGITFNCFSPDGTIVIECWGALYVSASFGPVPDSHSYSHFSILDAQNGQCLTNKILMGHRRVTSYFSLPSAIFAVAISRDNRSFAIACKDGTIQIWRALSTNPQQSPDDFRVLPAP